MDDVEIAEDGTGIYIQISKGWRPSWELSGRQVLLRLTKTTPEGQLNRGLFIFFFPPWCHFLALFYTFSFEYLYLIEPVFVFFGNIFIFN